MLAENMMPNKLCEENIQKQRSTVPNTAFRHTIAQALKYKEEYNLIPEPKVHTQIELTEKQTDNFTQCISVIVQGIMRAYKKDMSTETLRRAIRNDLLEDMSTTEKV